MLLEIKAKFWRNFDQKGVRVIFIAKGVSKRGAE